MATVPVDPNNLQQGYYDDQTGQQFPWTPGAPANPPGGTPQPLPSGPGFLTPVNNPNPTPQPPPAPGSTPPPSPGSQPTNYGLPPGVPNYNQIYGGLPSGPNTSIPLPYNQDQLSGFNGSLREYILNTLKAESQPVTANDPYIAPILSAMRGQSQRAEEQNQQQVAERLFGQGVPVSSGAYDSNVFGFNEKQAESLSGQTANVMLQQLNDRRNRLMTALNIGSTYLTTTQQQQLQAELGNVTNALASYGIKSNASLGILDALLRNAQFYDQLGNNIGQFTSNQNSNATNTFF